MTLAISSAHADLLVALRRTDEAPRVVVIGATALGHHVALRPTADVDLAIAADPGRISELLQRQGWKADRRLPQRWWFGDALVDVLPATQAAIDAGHVMLGDGHKLSTVGFDIALAHAAPVPIPGTDISVDVASLASIVLLKMVAFLDRPHERLKDAGRR
ncbi:MAG: nucleotidyl transferase AbiEii/AbiGii toxin family protein [Labilithrix sp.]|nr:nucleotidyl transferase AbiEii/AbiGii toxin family protein [Labilithrix sp.]MCW5809680.1 nucleotidyl transferase AbiEii/AbiGii toxin family protein [Labilithrix sp.]